MTEHRDPYSTDIASKTTEKPVDELTEKELLVIIAGNTKKTAVQVQTIRNLVVGFAVLWLIGVLLGTFGLLL